MTHPQSYIWFTERKDSFRPSASPVLVDYTKNFPFNLPGPGSAVECALVCNPGSASRPGHILFVEISPYWKGIADSERCV